MVHLICIAKVNTMKIEPHKADEVADSELHSDLSNILSPGDIIYDVGANRAQFANHILKICDGNIYCFEPVPADHDYLVELSSKEPRIHPVQLAITDDDVENVSFFVNKSSAGSSLLHPLEGQKSQWLTPDEKITAKASRLDKFIETHNKGDLIKLLKVDAQGADLKVLRSAGSYLSPAHIEAVVVEINYHSFYEGQNRLDDIIKLMDDRNYFIAGIYRHYNHKGWLWWSDFLFLPRDDRYTT